MMTSLKETGRSVLTALICCLLGITLLAPVGYCQASDTESRFRAATAAMQEGKLQEAEQGFRGITQTSPTFAEAHFNLGLTLEEMGRFEEAVKSFRKALELKPQ